MAVQSSSPDWWSLTRPAVTVTVPEAHDARNSLHAKSRWSLVDELRSPIEAAAMESAADSMANALKTIVAHIRLSFSTLKIEVEREPSGPAPLHTQLRTKITRLCHPNVGTSNGGRCALTCGIATEWIDRVGILRCRGSGMTFTARPRVITPVWVRPGPAAWTALCRTRTFSRTRWRCETSSCPPNDVYKGGSANR